MRPYEVVVIFDAGLEEDAIRAEVDKLTELVRSKDGTPNRVDRWGKRRFAYELKHRWEGYYVLLDLTAEPAAIAELDRVLHLSDVVLRHKVILLPPHVAGRVRPAAAVEAEATAAAGAEANGA